MKLNIVMVTKNRPKLTRQALMSLVGTTSCPASITIVDDCSDDVESLKVLKEFQSLCPTAQIITNDSPFGVGGSKNKGVVESRNRFGRGDYLYLSDNDAFFTPGWLEVLVAAHRAYGKRIPLIGGYPHPFLQPKRKLPLFWRGEARELWSCDAVCGLSWMMKWETWERFGRLMDNARGTQQSEDWEYSQRIVKEGLEVGAVTPAVVLNCGRTDSEGKKSPGDEKAFSSLRGVLVE